MFLYPLNQHQLFLQDDKWTLLPVISTTSQLCDDLGPFLVPLCSRHTMKMDEKRYGYSLCHRKHPLHMQYDLL